MNVDTTRMDQYAQFLADNSRAIVELCNRIEETLIIAVQCMDQQSGRGAAQRLAQNMENVKQAVPISDDASQRIIQSRRHIDSATSIFGR